VYSSKIYLVFSIVFAKLTAVIEFQRPFIFVTSFITVFADFLCIFIVEQIFLAFFCGS